MLLRGIWKTVGCWGRFGNISVCPLYKGHATNVFWGSRDCYSVHLHVWSSKPISVKFDSYVSTEFTGLILILRQVDYNPCSETEIKGIGGWQPMRYGRVWSVVKWPLLYLKRTCNFIDFLKITKKGYVGHAMKCRKYLRSLLFEALSM
jgi:hypothetical protein